MTSTKRALNYGGLRREPQMWEIIHYLENNQEKARFPDREARFVRNHPFMTQLDFLTCKTSRHERGRSKIEKKGRKKWLNKRAPR